MEETGVSAVAVMPLAQWSSRRIRSSASRAFCCASKRRFMSSSAFAPEVKSETSAVTTVVKMARTTRSSTRV